MRALKYHGQWTASLEHVPGLHCEEPDDVIVQIKACGICGTDIGILSGDYQVARVGVTLGHEAAGVVMKTGASVTRFSVGDRVVINPSYFCGQCRACSMGHTNQCQEKNGTEAGVTYNGAFADQYRTRQTLLRKLDDHISFDQATLVEPLSCAIAGVDKLDVKPDKNLRVFVIGAGPMGVLYSWALHVIGLNVIVVENNEGRRLFSEQVLPPQTVTFENFSDALESLYEDGDKKIDIAVDTTGSLTERIIDCLSGGGKLLTIALKNKIAKFSTREIADKSLSIIGSIDSLNDSFERAYRLIRDGVLPANRIISHVFDLKRFEEAFAVVGCDLKKKSITAVTEPNCKVILNLT